MVLYEEVCRCGLWTRFGLGAVEVCFVACGCAVCGVVWLCVEGCGCTLCVMGVLFALWVYSIPSSRVRPPARPQGLFVFLHKMTSFFEK